MNEDEEVVVCQYLKFPWRTNLFLCHIGDYFEESMIFCFDSNNCLDKEAQLLISKRGGFIVDDYFDDPHTIVLCDSTVEKDNKQRVFDRFDVKFIKDSVANNKLQSLNRYLIGESLFDSYDANAILHRKLKWSDVKKKEKRKFTTAITETQNQTNSIANVKNTEKTTKPTTSAAIDQRKKSHHLRNEKKPSELNDTTNESQNESPSKSAVDIKQKNSPHLRGGKTPSNFKNSADKSENESPSKFAVVDKQRNSPNLRSRKKPTELNDTTDESENESPSKSAAAVVNMPKNSAHLNRKNSTELEDTTEESKSDESESGESESEESESESGESESDESESNEPVNESPSKSNGVKVQKNLPYLRNRNKASESKNTSDESENENVRSTAVNKKKKSPSLRVVRSSKVSCSLIHTTDEEYKSPSKSPDQRKPMNLSTVKDTPSKATTSNKSKKSVGGKGKSLSSSTLKVTLSKLAYNKEKGSLATKSFENKRGNSSNSQDKATPSSSTSTAYHKCKDISSKLSVGSKERNSSGVNENVKSSGSTAYNQGKGTPSKSAGKNDKRERGNTTTESLETTVMADSDHSDKSAKSPVKPKKSNLSKLTKKVKAVCPPTSRLLKGRNTGGYFQHMVNSDTDSDSSAPAPMPLRSLRKRKHPSESPCGSPVSDISFNSSEDSEAKSVNNTTSSSPRRPYDRQEKRKILKFITDNDFYTYTRGNKIWKYLEKLGTIVPNRTHQSLKEHYRKQILPNLKNFKLPDYNKYTAAERLLDLNNGKKMEAPIDLDKMVILG